MQQMKQGVSKATPCILLDSTDFKTAETGVAYGSVTCSYRKEGATSWSTKSLSGKWTEVGGGVYLITWDAADLDTIGRFDYMCVSSGCLTYYGALQVTANLPDDIAALVTTVDGVVDDIAAAIAGLNDLSAADGHASGYNTVLQFCPARVLVLDDEGRALQGATVTFGATELPTDENGLTAWREFPAGEYLFGVAQVDYRSVAGLVTLEHRVSWVVILKYVGVLARHFGMRSVGAADSRSAGVSSADEASRSCDVDEMRSRGPRRLS